MNEKNISKKLQNVKRMPPLTHHVKGESFDITKSEVVNWLIHQPEILQWIFDHIANMQRTSGKELLIKYNHQNGKWQGIDYEPADD